MEGSSLLAALVDLREESLKNLLLQTLALVDLVNHSADLADALLLKLLVTLLQLHVIKQLLNDLLLVIVLAAVVLLEDFALLRCRNLESLVDQPRALVVLDIGADLTDVLGKAEVVQVVILHLEVLAERNENVLGRLEVLGSGEPKLVKSEGDREVERVVCGLVDDDEAVLLHGEVVKVDGVLRGGEKIAKLSHLGLECDLVEELDEVNVGGVRAEELLQERVDACLEHEGVVDGDHTDTLLAVPAGLATTGDGRVHNIIGHQEESLQQLGHPTECGSLEVLLFAEGGVEEDRGGVGDGHATIAFSTERVDLERLYTLKSVTELISLGPGSCSETPDIVPS